MKTLKEQIANLRATGNAGAGMVEVTINGEYKVLSVSINDIMLAPENKAMIETLVTSAFNDATDKMRENTEDFARRQAQGLGIPS